MPHLNATVKLNVNNIIIINDALKNKKKIKRKRFNELFLCHLTSILQEKNQWRFAFKELKGEEFQLNSKQM